MEIYETIGTVWIHEIKGSPHLIADPTTMLFTYVQLLRRCACSSRSVQFADGWGFENRVAAAVVMNARGDYEATSYLAKGELSWMGK